MKEKNFSIAELLNEIRTTPMEIRQIPKGSRHIISFRRNEGKNDVQAHTSFLDYSFTLLDLQHKK